MDVSLGTLNYMAPELIRNQDYDEKVDIWSVGVITFQLLTGKNLFHAVRREDVKRKILNTKAENLTKDPLLEKVSGEAKDFIFNCLRKSKDERMSADQLLKHPWLNKHIHEEINAKEQE